MTRRTMFAAAIAASALLLVFAGSAPAMAADDDNLVVDGGFDAPGYDARNGRFSSGDDMGGWTVGPQNENGFGSKTVQVWYPEMLGEGHNRRALPLRPVDQAHRIDLPEHPDRGRAGLSAHLRRACDRSRRRARRPGLGGRDHGRRSPAERFLPRPARVRGGRSAAGAPGAHNASRAEYAHS